MKKAMFNLMLAGLTSVMLFSCETNDSVKPGSGNNPPAGTPLVVTGAQTLGWGNGRASNEAYIGVCNGRLDKFMSIDDNDQATQEKVDLVFPGDWGSQGGGLTIAAPNSSGAGAASYEFCTNWLRKKATRITILDMDITGYEAITTVEQLKALDEEHYAYYDDWEYPLKENFALLIRTEEGKLALAWVGQVNGTYGSANANLKMSFKIMP